MQRNSTNAPVPLSYQQEMRLRRDVASLATHGVIQDHAVQAIFTISDGFDLVAFEQACQDVITRHPVLATAYSLDAGVPDSAHLLEPGSFRVATHATRESRSPGGAAPELAGADSVRPSPFTPGDFKFRCEWSPNSGRLLIGVDHIAIDATSWVTLLGDLSVAYDRRLAGSSILEEEPPAPYDHYAAEQRAQLEPAVVGERLSYWRGRLDPLAPFGEEVLAGASAPSVPARTARQAQYLFDVDLRAAARGLGLTPFSLVLAVHAAARSTRSSRSVVTTHLAADIRGAEYAGSVGWFTGGLVVRHRMDIDDRLVDVGADLMAAVFDALDHALPMAIMQEELDPTRLQSRRWRPACFLDVEDASDVPTFALRGCTVAEVEDEPSLPALRDGVACWFTAKGPRTHLLMQFEAEAWDDAAAATFIADIEAIFQHLAQHREVTLSALARLSWPMPRKPLHPVEFTS